MSNNAVILRRDFLVIAKKLGIKVKYMQYCLHIPSVRISGEGLLFVHLVMYSRPRFPRATALTCVPMQKVSLAV